MPHPHRPESVAASDPRYCEAHARIAELMQRVRSTAELMPGVLDALGTSFGWAFGAFWLPEANGVLACNEAWHAPDRSSIDAPGETGELEALTWELRLRPGIGLAGRAFRRRDVVCARHPGAGIDALRAAAARDDGLHAAVAVPLVEQPGDLAAPLGVLEFFTDQLESHDEWLPDALRALATQVAVFIARLELEHELTQERPVQIREEILENLWLAQTAIQTGRLTQAARLVDESIDAAQRMSDDR